GWFVGGTAHIGNSSSTNTTGRTSVGANNGKRVQAVFDRHYYYNTCNGEQKHQATKWNGLDIALGVDTVSLDGQCSTSSWRHQFPSTQTGWARTSNDAVYFQGAIDLGALSVESKSGYSTDVTSSW